MKSEMECPGRTWRRAVAVVILCATLLTMTVAVYHAEPTPRAGGIPAPASGEQSLVVATSADYWPMEYLQHGQIAGHDITLMDALAAKMGVSVTYVNVPFIELLSGLAAGQYDAVIASLSRTAERQQQFDFTVPYVRVGFAGEDIVAIAVRKGNHRLRRQLNHALWQVKADGTLASIVAAIRADRADWEPQLPRWVPIGVAQDLSRDLAWSGWAQLNAAELAVEQVNAQGGLLIGGQAYDVVVAAADSGCDAAQGLRAANELLAGGVVAVLGHTCSNAAYAAQPLYAAAGVPMISASATNPGLTRLGFATTFRVASKDDAAAELLANHLYPMLDLHRAATVERSGFWANYDADAFAEAFRALGGTITSRAVVNTTAEYTTTLTGLAAEGVEAIFYADDEVGNAALLSRVAHGFGMGDVVLAWDPLWGGGSELGPLLASYASAAGAAAEGDYVGLTLRPTTDMPGYAALNAAYQAADFADYGDEAGVLGAFAYDAATTILEALRRADSLLPADVRDQIAATPAFSGVVGYYGGFDANGDVIPQWAWLEQYHDGQWTRPVRVGLLYLPLIRRNTT